MSFEDSFPSRPPRDVVDLANQLCASARRVRALRAVAAPCCMHGATKGNTTADPCWACAEEASNKRARAAGQIERD